VSSNRLAIPEATMTNLCAALPLLLVSASVAATVRVEDHGAKGDGTTKDTAAIQAAIDACTAAGGGEVLFGPHRYLTGSLELRNNVTLKLDPQAVILGSEDLADYTNGGLIRGNGVTNSGIEGGTIDGRGDIWWDKAREYTGPVWRGTAQFEYQAKRRPSFVRFSGCSKVVVRDVLLTGSPSWTLHLYRSTDCLVERVKIRNPLYGPNTDGIDVNSCQRVMIRDCDIITGDDGIVLKSTDPGHDHPSEDITVERCKIWSACNCLKIGTETHDHFSRIRFADCHLYSGSEVALERPLSGVAIESVDGAILSDIVAESLTMDNVRAPLFIRLGHRGGNSERTQQVDPRVPGQIRDVTIRNVKATRSLFESSITGMVDHPVQGVTLSNLDLGYVGGEPESLAMATVPDADVVKRYPEAQMFGRLPAYGLYCRHVDGLTLDGVQLHFDQPDGRPAMVCDDVANLQVKGLRSQPPRSRWPVLWFLGVRQALLEGCSVTDGTKVFLVVEGDDPQTAGIRLGENDLPTVREPVQHVAPGGLVRQALPQIPEHGPGLVLIQPDQLLLAPPMATVDEPEAAPGKAIEVPLDKGRDIGTAQCRFIVSQAGDYHVWAKVYAPSGESNSYYLSIDGADPVLVDVMALEKWAWERAEGREQQGLKYTLPAGEHTLTIRNREAGTRLAAIVVSNAGPTFDAAEAWRQR